MTAKVAKKGKLFDKINLNRTRRASMVKVQGHGWWWSIFMAWYLTTHVWHIGWGLDGIDQWYVLTYHLCFLMFNLF